MDRVFQALAHADRRRILDILKAEPGSSVGHVASFFETSRIAVLKHIRVLEDAELIVSRKEGRVRHLHFNAMPIQQIHDRWTSEYSRVWARHVHDVKMRLEHPDAADNQAKNDSEEGGTNS